MKKRQGIHRGDAVSFRPFPETKEKLEKLAFKNTRSVADQIEHLVKIGLMVSEKMRTEDPEQIAEGLGKIQKYDALMAKYEEIREPGNRHSGPSL